MIAKLSGIKRTYKGGADHSSILPYKGDGGLSLNRKLNQDNGGGGSSHMNSSTTVSHNNIIDDRSRRTGQDVKIKVDRSILTKHQVR